MNSMWAYRGKRDMKRNIKTNLDVKKILIMNNFD